jgi:Peptidase family M48
MTYILLGGCLTLSAFLLTQTLAALLVRFVFRMLRGGNLRWSSERRFQLLLTLQVVPTVLAAALAFVLVLPSYLLYEPLASGESIGVAPALLTIFTLVLMGKALLLLWQRQRLTVRWLQRWMQAAVPITLPGSALPVYCLDHPFPLLAVVGIFRPRVLLARSVLQLLDNEELSVAIAHELGHISRRDNLKRVVARFCADVSGPAVGSALCAELSGAAEECADNLAAARDPKRALALATAMVKLARALPAGARAPLPQAVFLGGTQSGMLDRRIAQLLTLEAAVAPENRVRIWLRGLSWASIALAALGGCVFALKTGALIAVHQAIEKAIG